MAIEKEWSDQSAAREDVSFWFEWTERGQIVLDGDQLKYERLARRGLPRRSGIYRIWHPKYWAGDACPSDHQQLIPHAYIGQATNLLRRKGEHLRESDLTPHLLALAQQGTYIGVSVTSKQQKPNGGSSLDLDDVFVRLMCENGAVVRALDQGWAIYNAQSPTRPAARELFGARWDDTPLKRACFDRSTWPRHPETGEPLGPAGFDTAARVV